jgi:tRNA (guanine-N7-)-methyltransferase
MCKNVRIRRKPWARPELAACEFFIDDPPKYKGHWQELFGNKNPMHLELGCGKGVFIADVGAANKQIN